MTHPWVRDYPVETRRRRPYHQWVNAPGRTDWEPECGNCTRLDAELQVQAEAHKNALNEACDVAEKDIARLSVENADLAECLAEAVTLHLRDCAHQVAGGCARVRLWQRVLERTKGAG